MARRRMLNQVRQLTLGAADPEEMRPAFILPGWFTGTFLTFHIKTPLPRAIEMSPSNHFHHK